ncbi:MAG: SpoIIE family protein phosphatase, partial [Bacteroidota bacterium]|nr:SpoIIE family protein phosphatase [Bacteroidota bacterium]
FYLKAYVDLKNSMENEEQTKALLRQESKYEIAKKIDEKNAEQQKEKLIEEEKNKRKNYVIIAVILIMVVLAYAVIMSVKRLRTIQSQNTIIHSINNKLTMQKTEIMDSITYARRIQEAILPSETFLKNSLPDSFVIYIPKDIIAGDFYWMEKKGDKILIAVADCTGHGVPGALVSVVCSNALNRSVNEFGITEPGTILDKTRELVMETFSRSDKDVKDGMDISLASIDLQNLQLKWAGANNPLWYISENELNEITAHKQSIGKTEKPTSFLTHTLSLKKGDILYFFSDGFADQFGGPNGKKFKYKPLKSLLLKHSGLPMPEQKMILEATLREWKGDLEQVDDICLMGLRL